MVEAGLAAMGDAAEAFYERILAAIPMGHLGQATDIANAVLFLASNESRYMTGSELVVDGGYTAH
jgi:NAD(P)-dependent dehydrogenase (short-subunit alcohol dehydrogenase family)